MHHCLYSNSSLTVSWAQLHERVRERLKKKEGERAGERKAGKRDEECGRGKKEIEKDKER